MKYLRAHRMVSIAAAVLALVFIAGLFWFLVPEFSVRAALLPCEFAAGKSQQDECVYARILTVLKKGGIAPAMHMFLVGNAMFPATLEQDCHAGTHRVGDMVYYNLFVGNPDLSAYDFSPETAACGEGFYHGFFEHLVQDHPSPAFIVKTCAYFKNNPKVPPEVYDTCFHASGHGLVRAQAEIVPKKDWGNAAAFVTRPVEACRSLPNATDYEKYRCTTGVESIFIQMSDFGNYGFSATGPNTLAVCDTLEESLHGSCYREGSLMVAQQDDGYVRALSNCELKAAPLFDECVQGTILGLFTNGLNENSYRKGLAFCNDTVLADRRETVNCFKRLGSQLAFEYQNFRADCKAFPEQYRSYCLKPISPGIDLESSLTYAK